MEWFADIISNPSWEAYFVALGSLVIYVYRKFNKSLTDQGDLASQTLAAITEIKASLEAITAKTEEQDCRLNSIDETMYYVLDGVIQNGANGIVKKYRDKCASAGRWDSGKAS